MIFEHYFDRAAEFGVSRCEAALFLEIVWHIPLRRKRMPRWAAHELDFLSFSEADFESAIESCISKGWLRELTDEDVQQAPPSYSTYSEHWSAGQLDWTIAGNVMAREIFGDDAIEPGH